MKIQTALKAAALAATLVFSTASHATAGISYAPLDEGVVYDPGAPMLHGVDGWQAINTYTLTVGSLTDILAFCIQPTVEQGSGTIYTQHAPISSLSSLFADDGLLHRGARVQALFEQNYANVTSPTATSAAREGFALALWELVADDANLSSGLQAFSGSAAAFDPYSGDTIELGVAQDMLNATENAALTGAYKYTLFTGTVGATGPASQSLLSVSTVPEADTWAMMALGLGLVGFMGRRKTDKSEKFAA